jgi:hypothetical protein
MLKGSVITTHMLLFLGSMIMAVGLMFSLLYVGVGLLTKSEIYDAKMMSEMLSGAISVLSSTSLNGTVIFRIPVGLCVINITEDKTKVTIPTGNLFIQKKTAKVVREQTSELSNIRPDYIKIHPINTECSKKQVKIFVIQKIENDISFDVG